MNLKDAKTIYKPWGKEVWLELNERYCYKRIYINAGHRTSYQYHNSKIETNYIIKGQAEVWLETDDGIIEKLILGPGDFFNVYPPKKHRVIAITDIILQETSTPEVDDVIRIEDDSNRSSGKIGHEHARPAMCIVAAGKGVRLGKLVENFHKGLLPINNKAIISHIIDKVPEEFDIVIAIGYNGKLIEDYCKLAHPDRELQFVIVNNVEGEGSGPGHSLHLCKPFLQRPFYLTTVDCLIKEDFPLLDGNWIGVSPTSIPEIYSTAEVNEEGVVTAFKNKDTEGYQQAFIGLCGIYEYEVFWNNLEKHLHTGELVGAFYNISEYSTIVAKNLEWFDIGTIENYHRAKKEFSDGILYGIPKDSGQVLYRVNDRLIKYDKDTEKIKNIVDRANYLNGLVPDIVGSSENLYSYNWVNGSTLYDVGNKMVFESFLSWMRKNMFLFPGSPIPDITEECRKFYNVKTYDRLDQFISNRDSSYLNKFVVEGTTCIGINDILEMVDWEELEKGTPIKKFHGDLQFDNVIYTNQDFKLIDWRSDFGGNVEFGDIYYDLAKLYGGILMSYSSMKDDNNMEIWNEDNNISWSYALTDQLQQFKTEYEVWLIKECWDLDRVKKITALIYLNMAPLHSTKFGDILFFKSLKMLNDLYYNDK